MALLKTTLKRSFTFKNKDKKDIILEDINPSLKPEAVLNFYSMDYPELTTAKIEGPIINNDVVEYKFTTTLGTKG